MYKLAPVVLLVLAACGGSSRADECEVEGCDQATVDQCVAFVEACEEAGGGDGIEDVCIDASIDANDLLCELTTPTAAGT